MPSKRKPSYLLHKPTGQARCRIDGRDHYLGEYGSPESRERYDDLVVEWFAKQGDVTNHRLTVDELALLYLQHADQHYRKPDGSPTGEAVNVRIALRHAVQVHGRTRVRDFGPKALKEVRQSLIDADMVRTSINKHVSRIRQMFKWAVAEELAPEAIWSALSAVAGLRQGRTKARESQPVKPVDEGTVSDTLAVLTPTVATMVRLQLLTGARPGEVCSIRPIDITFGTDGVWTYRPKSHKNEHHGKERRIHIGPEGQELLRPFLDREPEAFCFSPAESESERNAERRANRQSAMTPSQAKRKPAKHRGSPPKNHYTKDSYGRAIKRACEVAFGMPGELRAVPKALPARERERLLKAAADWRAQHCWSPNQLRHSRATIIRERYGIEAAQVVLGHSDPGVTQIYAEQNFERAARVMREIG